MLYEFVPSLHQEHVNLLCILPILVYMQLKQVQKFISFMRMYICQYACSFIHITSDARRGC